MDPEDYPSDSEQSDEDYCPNEDDIDSIPSDVAANSEASDDNANDDKKNMRKNSEVKRKRKKKQRNNSNKIKKLNSSLNNNEDNNDSDKVVLKIKEHTLCHEDDKKHEDALWADFLNDAKTNDVSNDKNDSKTNKINTEINVQLKSDNDDNDVANKSTKIETKEIFTFAGETIAVTKDVPQQHTEIKHSFVKKSINDISNNSPLNNNTIGRGQGGRVGTRGGIFGSRFQRGGGSTGIGSILGQLSKTTKISTLEKSKLDWNNFKKNEGIDEDLQTYNKGKDGFLERKDFLQRTDVRQFEIERQLRLTKRSNR